MKRKHNLNYYLITRFLMALAFILVAEALLNVFFTGVAFPQVNRMFHRNIFSNDQPADVLFILVKGLGWLLLSGISNVLPYSFARPIQEGAKRLAEQDLGTLFHGQVEGGNEWTSILLIGVFVAFIVLYLLPYGIAILFYSRRIVQEVKMIQEEDKQRQEEEYRNRNLLLSDIAHDLKTPITTIAGYAEALNGDMVDSSWKRTEYLTAISAKSMQLSQLITLLFDYVTLDSEGFQLNIQKEDISELMKEVIAGQYSDIEEAGMELEIQIPEEAIYGNVDGIQIKRVVNNLLVNAMRHNETGTKILVSLRAEEEHINICVEDSGGLIDESIRKTLFEPFVRGDYSRSKAGSGLGLSIASRIAELHGGSIVLNQPTKNPYSKEFCITISK